MYFSSYCNEENLKKLSSNCFDFNRKLQTCVQSLFNMKAVEEGTYLCTFEQKNKKQFQDFKKV